VSACGTVVEKGGAYMVGRPLVRLWATLPLMGLVACSDVGASLSSLPEEARCPVFAWGSARYRVSDPSVDVPTDRLGPSGGRARCIPPDEVSAPFATRIEGSMLAEVEVREIQTYESSSRLAALVGGRWVVYEP
jgi:hypothetical protein